MFRTFVATENKSSQLRYIMLAAALLCLAPTPLPAQTATPTADPWYNHAVIYEIYPRSFQDTNADGIGDLNGITQHLDYLQHLGVDAIWIAPMYPSPQVDFGYDISNYETVDPQYGTLADMDRLIAAGKTHHIRVLLDMVLNHTSDKHPWFLESAASRTNPKADWYVWNDGKPGTGPNAHTGPHGSVVPPNNWVSLFGGSAWEWVPSRGQFFYHRFYKQQPDLNWRNPKVEAAMFASMQFWLDRGVAGFRLDAIPSLFEDPRLRNEPETGGTNAQGDPNLSNIYTDNVAGVHDVIRRMRAMVAKYPGDRVLLGETYLPNTADLDQWYGGAAHDELQLAMDMLIGFSNHPGKLDANQFRRVINEAETQLHGSQPLVVFDNHDNARSWDRFGDGVHNPEIARALATILFTTRSTALTYYGAELGMSTQTPTRVEDVRDPIGITGWPLEKGRDGERTPMQWNADPQAGFSTNPRTWLPVEHDYATVNVATETAEPDSLLNWYRTLIAIRRDNRSLHNGDMTMLDTTNPSVLSYLRTATTGARPLVIAVNMTDKPQTVHLDLTASGIKSTQAKTLLADAASLNDLTTLTTFTLPPYASLIAEVQ